MFKKHIIFQILYIIVGPLCPASLKRHQFKLREEQSRVTDTVMKLLCVCKQAAIKTISDGLYTPLWCDPVSLSLTHTHTSRD